MKTVFLTKWRERLNDPTGIKKYKKLSIPWTTCATGDRVFQELGRRSKNYLSSLSKEAEKIGTAFNDAVEEGNREEAQRLLEQIENFPSIWKFDVKEELKDPCPTCGHKTRKRKAKNE